MVGVSRDSESGAGPGVCRRPLRPLDTTHGSMEPFETDVQLPNINCKKCTLQVIQFMAEHAFNNPGGTPITTARSCRSRPTRRNRWIARGRLSGPKNSCQLSVFSFQFQFFVDA